MAPLAGLLLGGCVTVRAHALRSAFAGDYCAPPRVVRPPRPSTPAEPAELEPSAAVARRYSRSSLDTARAIGALQILDRIEALTAAHAPEDDVLAARQALNAEIYLADLDVTSIAAEIECDRSRATQAATALRDADADETRALTAASVIVGAATAVATGILTATNVSPLANGLTGVGGGVAGGALGVWSLSVHHALVLHHTRNPLREVWTAPARAELFPESVWTYLSRPQFTAARQRSIRETLVQQWQELGRLGHERGGGPSRERVRLFFGNGGSYDADALDDRGDMLAELHGAVDLMHQELQQLATEVWRP